MNKNIEPSYLGSFNPSALWVIQMIRMAGYIDGIYRLQKYAFILCKTIKHLDKIGLYKDWVAGEYGPYSQKLHDDIELLKKENIIKTENVANDFDKIVERFTTNVGNEVVEELEKNISQKEYKEVADAFKKIINNYSGKPTIDILYDIYLRFPKYAISSIKSDQSNTKLTQPTQ